MGKTKTTHESAQVPARWDEELARQAQLTLSTEESTATGAFFGLKGGILTFDKLPIPGNQMAVIVVDALLENIHFAGEYDPDVVAAPTCFAFGRLEKELRPHQVVVEAAQAQSESCQTCPHNVFGSADKGRGKACRNTRRLALIPAGTLDAAGKFIPFTKTEQFSTSVIGFMKLPVTSVKAYSAYVKQLAAVMRRPPHAVVTKIVVVPDKDTQFKVLFEPLGNVSDVLLEVVMKRHEEAAVLIGTPYSLSQPDEESATRGARKKQPAAKKARKY